MNKKTLEKLEFNKICNILSNYSITYIGKNLSNQLIPQNDEKIIQKSQKQTSEAEKILYKIGVPPISEIENINLHLKKLSNSNSLSIKQLLDLNNILKISENLKHYFLNNDAIIPEEYPNLSDLFDNLYTNTGIKQTISNSILDENTLDDNASPTLKNIRNNIRKKETEIHTKLNSILHSKFVQEPIVTFRNGRFVIPVKSEYRTDVRGFLHDSSASGATVFIEPISVFEINNEITNLHNDENLEIEKILMKLSSLFFDLTENLENTSNLIGLIDFIFAKAKYSKTNNFIEPIINKEKFIDLKDCYHPLISKDIVVKNTISLGKNYTSLIITGPNTGGKTVVLKTVGLTLLMAMAGLHIPAKEGSSIFIFDEIFADIGDEQSISDSLSTFSSHIKNIVNILNNSTENSLVLLDELGSGTDPIEGSSLAISILDNLKNNSILTLATTHYHELKEYALITDGFENASVEFNFDKLSPTYKLLIGVPGRSNAFIISKKLGISNQIIEKAKTFINTDVIDIETLLNNIYEDKRTIEHEKEKIIESSSQIEKLKLELETKNNLLSEKENEIIENAKNKARDLLINAKDEANQIIRELEKSSNAQTSNTLRKKLNEKINNLSTTKKEELSSEKIEKNEIKIGLEVRIPNLNQTGIIISNPTKDNLVQVQIGSIKTTAKISELTKSLHVDNKSKPTLPTKRKKDTFKPQSISPEINVIGQNIEEACFVIDKYLDTCYLNGLNNIRIVHGKGTGILRKGIHDFLKKHPHVKSYRIGTFGEGEMGVTIVTLK